MKLHTFLYDINAIKELNYSNVVNLYNELLAIKTDLTFLLKAYEEFEFHADYIIISRQIIFINKNLEILREGVSHIINKTIIKSSHSFISLN